jgi:tetratricopeptide (TPR) repeat protein
LLALGSKEISASLPFFIILYEWYFFQDLSPAWIKKRMPLMGAVLILLLGIALIYLGGQPFGKISSMYAAHPLTMAQRALSQFRVVLFYIGLLLWPHPARLNLDYDFQPSHSLLDPATTLLGMIAIIAFLVVAVLTAKKQRLVSFCVLWYLGNLVIESSVIALELVFEHRNYLPSMFFILLGVFFSFRYLKPKWLAPLLLSVVVVIGAFWTFERNEVWRSPLLIWKDTIKKSPKDPRPYTNLGVALYDRGYYDLAVEQYHHALKLDPEYVHAHANIGQLLARQDHLEEAVEHLSTALEINPNHYEAHNNLGIALAMQKHDQQAIEHFLAALKINPDYVQAHNNLGVAFKKQGHFQEAAVHFNAALKLDPAFVPAYNNLGLALAEQGRLEEAIAHFTKALEINPNYAAAQRNLEETQARRKNPSMSKNNHESTK